MRHLLFFVYPKTSSCWRFHFDRLEQYRDVWDGRKVVVAALDDKADKKEEVQARALRVGAEFVEVRNDPDKGEAAHFENALSRFRGASGSLFYAHGKGVSHTWHLENVLAWADGMYFLALRDPELIDRLMRDYKAVGSFRKNGWHGGGPWHFSGAFFWVNMTSALSAKMMPDSPDRYAVEGFPGRAVPFDQSFCLTPEIDHGNLYLTKLPMASCEIWLRELRKRFL